MNIKVYKKEEQAYGAFNNGEIIENKPIGFPNEGGVMKAFSNLFYWANAYATVDSTIGLHPHKGFEIMSFVLEGTIKHFDTQMDSWKELRAGDVQIIRSGNGISHAEFMEKDARMFQIWVDPNLELALSKEASYDDYRSADFPIVKSEKAEEQILIGGQSPLRLDADGLDVRRIKIFNSEYHLKVSSNNYISAYVLDGQFETEGTTIVKDDFFIIDDVEEIYLVGSGELFLFSVSKELNYVPYAQRFS